MLKRDLSIQDQKRYAKGYEIGRGDAIRGYEQDAILNKMDTPFAKGYQDGYFDNEK